MFDFVADVIIVVVDIVVVVVVEVVVIVIVSGRERGNRSTCVCYDTDGENGGLGF